MEETDFGVVVPCLVTKTLGGKAGGGGGGGSGREVGGNA